MLLFLQKEVNSIYLLLLFQLHLCLFITWSSCSVSCGGGVSTRSRACPNDEICQEETKTRLCNSISCIVDFCQSSPCGTHQCISSDEDFKCICNAGYTGITCDSLVDFCTTNNCEHGQCENTETGYKCICNSGYDGYLCDVLKQYASWGVWSEWSDCSAICGAGQRNRNRICNNPPPISDDETCEGDKEESETCYTDCYDACLSNPCGEDHSCRADANGYKCKCKNGYTGADCSVSPNHCVPNPCENSGECVSTSEGFNCTCVGGYSGYMCDVIPDKSVWQPWSGWGPCSVTCGGGKQRRQRKCKPGTNGEDCPGQTTEARECRKNSCPRCPSLRQFYGINKNCEKIDEVTTCTLTCIDDHFPPNSTYSSDNWTLVYQCGPFSSYLWNLTDYEPSCTESSILPNRIRAQASVPVSPQVSCGKSSAYEASMLDLVSNFVCLHGTNCSITADVTRCSNRKRRQTSEEGSEITFTFSFDFDQGTDSGNSSITGYWDTVEDSLSPLTTNSGDWLSVEIDGVKYVADTSNITKGASLECSTGYFLQDEHDICVGCSPGTMYDARNGYCISCPVGTYQELAAQTWCGPCPEGYTTNTTGSYDQKQCYNTKDAANNDDSVIIGAAVGGCVSALLVAISVVVIVKIKRAHMKNKISQSSIELYENKDCNEKSSEKLSREKSSTSLQTTSDIPLSVQDIDTAH